MENITLTTEPYYTSRFSFKPLFNRWQQKINEGRKGTSFYYNDILKRVAQYPELMEPIEDISILEKHPALLEIIMSTVFPVTHSDTKELYAVAVPFTYDYVFTSKLFRQLFLDEKGKMNVDVINNVASSISRSKCAAAYQIILNKFYGLDINVHSSATYPYADPVTGLTKYLELKIDAQFIDAIPKRSLPSYEELGIKKPVTDVFKIENIETLLPLDQFVFEGMAIIHLSDVTEREVVSEIKNELLNLHSFAEEEVFINLERLFRNLVGLPGVHIGITPFFKVNDHVIFSDVYYKNSILLKHHHSKEAQDYLYKTVSTLFNNDIPYLVFNDITTTVVAANPFLGCVEEQGGRSAIVAPLKSGREMIGLLVLMCKEPGVLTETTFARLDAALPLFTLALEKSAETLDNEIDHVIKEQFTAVQSSVEWKFTEAAVEFITKKKKGEEAKIHNLVFENVFPLYGAIDIRNSSTERNQAIQQDLLEQLNATGVIVKKAAALVNFPVLNEIQYKIEKYIYTVSNILFSGDEHIIHEFLRMEIVQLFRHLKNMVPAIKGDIDNYFGSLDAHIEMLYHHRKDFEDSINLINSRLARFIDEEQVAAQQVYPHYFERFITDGVDFNIYIGQSITPNRQFDQFYLKNLKMWQLTTLAKAARMTHQLESTLSLPLHTTQLILAHSNPISISFRTDERKFDVDGAYNIRYEIIKKRIDKVRIKETNERLTQPGKLAIVYSQPREVAEYEAYIEFLQRDGLLTAGEPEHFDLEELQGVSGLKAIRVGINLTGDTLKETSSSVILQPAVK